MSTGQGNLTLKKYVDHLDHLIEALGDQTLSFLTPYPALRRLLLGSCKKRERREYVIALLSHIRKKATLSKVQPERDKRTDQVFSYSLTISMGYLSEIIWGMKPKKPLLEGYKISRTAQSLSILFAETMVINRQTASGDQVQGLQPNESCRDRRVIYRFWVDSWSEAQLRVKEEKAQAWINAGAPAKLVKDRAIEIWGQPAADAVTQDGRKKTRKAKVYERFCEQAYSNIVARTGRQIVSKAEMLEELKKRVPHRLKTELTQEQKTEEDWQKHLKNEAVRKSAFPDYEGSKLTRADIRNFVRKEYADRYKKRCENWPEMYWQAGLTALLSRYELECRQLQKAEKLYYGIEAKRGTRFLIPAAERSKGSENMP